MKTLRFGIEIETVGASRPTIAAAIATVLGGNYNGGETATDSLGRTWKVVPDGSLAGGYDRSGEIVSPILTYADLDTLQAIVRAVRAAGARVDSSCGIHVHIDSSTFTAKSVVNLVKTVHKQERLIEHALRIAPSRLERYCRPIDADFMARLESTTVRTMADVSNAWYGYSNSSPNRYDSSRYHGLNLNSHFFRGTVEFRYFSGSLHAGEVKAYVQFALALAARSLTMKAASSKRREFNVDTAKYDFRVLMIKLGLIGDEFKTCRLHLSKHLEGTSATKRAVVATAAVAATETAAAVETADNGAADGE